MEIDQFQLQFADSLNSLRNRLQSSVLLTEQLQQQNLLAAEALEQLASVVDDFMKKQQPEKPE